MQHIIITGGAGFIGSHLCDLFLQKGYAVTAIDNLITGRKSNLKNALSYPQFFFYQQDICQPITIKNIPFLAQYGLQGLLHFACPASPVDFEKIPFDILAVDSIGTINTVELALQFECRYLLASTSEIYGDPQIHPQPENYWGHVNPIGPRACYDETKRFAEAYVSTAIRMKSLNAGIARIFNTYGPRMRIDDGRIIPELCRKTFEHQAFSIYGDGQQTRSFCYISDLVQGLFQLFNSQITEPINLGNPEEKTLLQLIEILCQITQQKRHIRYLPHRTDDPKRRCPDIRRAQALLHWTPSVCLNDGLKLTLQDFQH